MKNIYRVINNVLLLLVLLFILSSGSSAQTFYNVSGRVYLEDKVPAGPFDSVKIRFISLIDLLPKDSTYSNTEGTYSLKLAPGYYFAEWTKKNYVPEEQKGIQVAGDIVLPDKTLMPGRVEKVSGSVSGTWDLVNGYYEVTGDITVPMGQTLIIKPGVKVRFRKATGLICYGSLIADGTIDAGITFTSREVEPTPGDWKSIQLFANNNSIKYANYEYAADGIQGNGASGTSISFVKIKANLASNANGFYFENSMNLRFENNEIYVDKYGIYAPRTQESSIKGNIIKGNTKRILFSIFMDSSKSCSIESNNLSGTISLLYSSGSSISGNFIKNRFIDLKYSIDMIVNYNIINEFGMGINADYSQNSVINYNRLTSSVEGGAQNISEDAESLKNTSIAKRLKVSKIYMLGISALDAKSLIKGNFVSIGYTVDAGIYGIYASGVTVEDDTVKMGHNDHEDAVAIVVHGKSVVRKCVIETDGGSPGIRAGDSTDIQNNEIYSSTSNLYYLTGSSITGNTFHNGSVRIANGSIGNVINNIFLNGGINCSNSTLHIKGNIIKQTRDPGIYADKESKGEIMNNTVICTKDSSYGIYLDNSSLAVSNNIVQGFEHGIYCQSPTQNMNIKYNNFWNIKDTIFLGGAMPPLIGQKVDINSNGDTSDIFKNIFMNPEFVDPTANDYHLKLSSHMINAGDPSIKDPDGSASDIGAYPAAVFMTIKHTPLKDTSETSKPYTVTAEVFFSSAVQVSVQLFYRVNGAGFVAVPMTLLQGVTYKAEIPGQPLNAKVDYYIKCTDGVHEATSPSGAPGLFYSFKIISPPVMLPSIPVLHSPQDGSKDASLAAKMIWKMSLNADTYRFQMAQNSAFTDWKIDEPGLADTTREIKSLKEGVKYFWRVCARNSAGETAFSNAWNFTTILNAPDNLSCSVPNAGEILLIWKDNSANEAGYIVERKAGDSYKALETVNSNVAEYSDKNVTPGTQYYYRIAGYTADAVSAYSNVASITATDVKKDLMLPDNYVLFQNYPNPFNPVTIIKYALPEESAVRLRVYSVLGKAVKEYYIPSEAAGFHEMKFDGGSYASGVYYYSIEARSFSGHEEFRSIRKMILLK